jgi:ABC-type transporter Mla MlaB component
VHTDPDPSAAVVKGASLNDVSVGSAASLEPVPNVRTGGLLIVVRSEPHATIAFTGELDLSGVAQVEAAISALDPADHHVTIDMSELEFIDLAGLVAISESIADLRANGRKVDLIFSDAVSWLLMTLEAAGCPMALVSDASQPPAVPG